MNQNGLVRKTVAPNEESLIHQYEQLVTSCVSKYTQDSYYDDVYQEAYLGLILAIRLYKDTHGCSLHTFAYICITNKIKTYLSSIKKHVTLEDDIEANIQSNISDIFPSSLSLFEKELIYFRLSNYTFKEISNYYNIKLPTLISKYKKIIKKLRKYNV